MAYALALTLVLTVALPVTADYVPAGFAAYSEDLEADGYVNGFMDSDRMLTAYRCTLERDAAYTFALMMDAAEKAGIRIGTEDCYRSYWHQQSAWERRCPYTDVKVRVTDPETGEASWGTRSIRKCSGPPTARAGLSNHGWGRAVDFTDGWGVLSCSDSAFHWLQANAYRFGWVHPPWAHCGMPTEEAWHWEWAGVVDENLVPDYSSIWIFDELTQARIRSDSEYQPPLPPIALESDQYYVGRWLALNLGSHLGFPDQ